MQFNQLTCKSPSGWDRLGLLCSAGLPGKAVSASDVLWDGHAPEPGDSIDLQHMPASQPWPAHTCVHVDSYAFVRLSNLATAFPFSLAWGG